jgi:hypothetical protein
MTYQEKQIAMAEALNWGHITNFQCRPMGSPPGKGILEHQDLPRWPSDLNAMHEAWQRLTDQEQMVFADVLSRVIMGRDEPRSEWLKSPLGSVRMAINATADQRNEAFILIKGKWRGA